MRVAYCTNASRLCKPGCITITEAFGTQPQIPAGW